MTRGAVYNWENGLSPPTTKNIRKMAELFGVTVGDFWSKPPRARRKRAA